MCSDGHGFVLIVVYNSLVNLLRSTWTTHILTILSGSSSPAACSDPIDEALQLVFFPFSSTKPPTILAYHLAVHFVKNRSI